MTTATDLIIRPVTVGELYQIGKYIPAFYEEFGQHPAGDAYRYDANAFILTWMDWLHDPSYTLLGAFDGPTWVGGLGGMVHRHPYTKKTLMGVEHFWYVTKEYRRTGIGTQLIERFERWLKSKGASYMIMLYIHGGPSEQMAAFYEHEGFSPMETQVMKRIR